MARIGIDVRKIADFGIGRYIERLIHHLSRQAGTENRFFLFGSPRALDCCPVASDSQASFVKVPERSRSYSLAEHFSLPLALQRCRIDLYHSTHYVLPQSFLPRLVVTSVHDLIHLLFPEHLPSRPALWYARHFIRRAARRSTAIITGSETTRNDLLRHCPRSAGERLHVIPYGVDRAFGPPTDAAAAEADRLLLRSLGIDGDYFLYLGNFKAHKNLSTVIQAFDRYLAAGGPERLLVLVGRELADQDGLDGLRKTLPRPGLLRALGYQPDARLPGILRRATAFLFPSLYEGFGLPPLEAMACGTPVIASQAGALPEVLGDAALFVDPGNPETIARAMRRLIEDRELAEELRRRGKDRAGRFRWEETARRTLALYRSLLHAGE